MSRTHVAVVLSLSLLALAAQAQDTPNFSGEWVLNKAKSTLIKRLADIEKGVVRIEHHDPIFKFHRTFTRGGKDDTYAYELTTDGKEVVSEEVNRKLYSRLYWEDSALVFFTRIVAPQWEATNIVYYRLLDDGRELQAEEHVRGLDFSHDNLWVFDRQ
jgi:hypothetical protein